MTEERRGFRFEGETGWLTLTELQARLSGAPTKHVMAFWEDGRRTSLEKIADISLEGAMVTIYRSPDGTVVLGGLGWIERLEWEKSQTEEG